jgi:hypothetical protein
MSADGRWDWADSTHLQYNDNMRREYIDFCDKNVPTIFLPLTPTRRQRPELDAAIAEVKANVKESLIVPNRIRSFTVNCTVEFGDGF